MTTEQKIKTSLSILFIIYFLSACSGSSEPKGAYWEGNANFMHITKGKKDMIYAVDVIGQKVFLEGYYEIIKELIQGKKTPPPPAVNTTS